MVPPRILEMFACIILKWHFDVKEEFPEHPLVIKVESLQTVGKLAEANVDNTPSPLYPLDVCRHIQDAC